MGIKDPRVPVDLKVTHVEVVAGISALTVDGVVAVDVCMVPKVGVDGGMWVWVCCLWRSPVKH